MSTKKDSSQKFFSVQFVEDNQIEVKTTKVPAKKGKTLKDAVDQLFLNHNLSYETHSIFLETSKTPLPVTSDCFMYGGCTLNVRANDEADQRIVSMMKEEDRKSPDRTKRYSGLLLHFCTHGFDEDETDGVSDSVKFDTEFYLENSWRDVVNGVEEMESKKRVQQESIWEMLTTEKTYISDIRVVTEVFKKCFKGLQAEGYLTEVDSHLIFANIEEIYEVNVEFWKLLISVIRNSRKTKEAMKPSDLVNAFDRFEVLFQPYIKFCNEDASNVTLPHYGESTNEQLKEFFLWCDDHPRCKRIQFQGFLIKPLQRVTKYSLLLRAVAGKTVDESEKLMLDNMRSRVETFVSKINSAVHMRQEQEKLLSVIAKFETYLPVEAVNEEAEKIMNEYSKLDLKGQIPGFPVNHKRFILKDGPMRLIEKQMKKEVQAFLFSDVFILARLKKNTEKYKVIRQPFRLNKMVIRVLKDPGSFLFIYLNEFDVLSNAFVLQINPAEQAQWLTTLEKAKNDYDLAIREYQLKEEEDNVDGDIPTGNAGKKRMRNRFSSRNSTIRAPVLAAGGLKKKHSTGLLSVPTLDIPNAEPSSNLPSDDFRSRSHTTKSRPLKQRPLTPNLCKRSTMKWDQSPYKKSESMDLLRHEKPKARSGSF